MYDLFMLMTSDPSLYLHAGENLLIMESSQVIENHLQSATDLFLIQPVQKPSGSTCTRKIGNLVLVGLGKGFWF